MAFSAGVFSRLYNWVNDRDAAIKILASRMDAEMDGMATGLSTCVLKDGTQTITANIPMATYKFTGLGAGTGAGESVRYEQVVLLSAGASQTITRSANGINLVLESTADPDPSTLGPQLVLFNNSGTGATDGDLGGALRWDMDDSGGTQTTFARIHMVADDITDTTEDGSMVFAVMTAGTLANELILTGANLYPNANDGLALGLSGNGFSDAFFASGAVLNFGAGNYTATHSAGDLLFSGTVSIGNADTTIGRNAAGALAVEGNALGAANAAFRVIKNGDLALSANNRTQVTTFTESLDQGSKFASDTWTPPAGWVHLTGRVTIVSAGWASDGTMQHAVYIYKNGSVLVGARTIDISAIVTAVDVANGTDTYTLYTENSNGNDVDALDADSVSLTWFTGSSI